MHDTCVNVLDFPYIEPDLVSDRVCLWGDDKLVLLCEDNDHTSTYYIIVEKYKSNYKILNVFTCYSRDVQIGERNKSLYNEDTFIFENNGDVPSIVVLYTKESLAEEIISRVIPQNITIYEMVEYLTLPENGIFLNRRIRNYTPIPKLVQGSIELYSEHASAAASDERKKQYTILLDLYDSNLVGIMKYMHKNNYTFMEIMAFFGHYLLGDISVPMMLMDDFSLNLAIYQYALTVGDGELVDDLSPTDRVELFKVLISPV